MLQTITHDQFCILLSDEVPKAYRPRGKYYVGYYCLQFASSGRLRLQYEDEVYEQTAPVCWISYPGPWIHHERAPGCSSWHHHYVAFAGALPDQWWHEGLIFDRPQSVQDLKAFKRLLEPLLKIGIPDTPLDQRLAARLTESILLHLAQERQQQFIGQPWLTQVMQRLNDPRIFSTSLEELAQEMDISEITLRRRFKKAMGCTPQEWIVRQRMNRAAELLQDSQLTITDVSERLGYPSIYQFSKQFKKWIGLAPSQWREAKLSQESET